MPIFERAARAAGQPPILDKIGDKMQKNLDRVMNSVGDRKRLEDTLHGTWLGHPLHPMLTDVPIGAWTMTGIFDAMSLLGAKSLRGASTVTTAIGVLSAVPAAVSGAVDWQHTGGESRRIGVSHAILNSAALLCQTTALVCRLSGARGPAVTLGFAGLGLTTASAYLGGHLVMASKIGVRHEPIASPPGELVRVAAEEDLAPMKPSRVEVDGYPILLVRDGTGVHAFDDVCPHLGCSLADGSIDDGMIRCVCHDSAFRIADGSLVQGPSAYPLRKFVTAQRDGNVYIVPATE